MVVRFPFFRYPDRVLDDSCLSLASGSSQKQRVLLIKKKGVETVNSTILTLIQMVAGGTILVTDTDRITNSV